MNLKSCFDLKYQKVCKIFFGLYFQIFYCISSLHATIMISFVHAAIMSAHPCMRTYQQLDGSIQIHFEKPVTEVRAINFDPRVSNNALCIREVRCITNCVTKVYCVCVRTYNKCYMTSFCFPGRHDSYM